MFVCRQRTAFHASADLAWLVHGALATRELESEPIVAKAISVALAQVADNVPGVRTRFPAVQQLHAFAVVSVATKIIVKEATDVNRYVISFNDCARGVSCV